MRLLTRSMSAALLLILVAAAAYHLTRSWSLRTRTEQATHRQAALPPRMLWVWERAEDLHAVDVHDTGIAALEATLRLGSAVVTVPRRQPLIALPLATRIAVVRLETETTFAEHSEDAHLLQAAEQSILQVAQRPAIAALQIDFDATRSQRAFYRRLLIDLRRQMPASLPLDITALASWCSADDWIHDLPVNEATPMFFRMEPNRRRVLATGTEFHIREPLCMGSVGVSTREPWPQDVAGKRVYIFADRGWQQDLSLLEPRMLASSSVLDRKHL